MLDCRRCKEDDCGFKKDILKALGTIRGYIPSGAIEQIEDIIQSSAGDCEDYKEMEN